MQYRFRTSASVSLSLVALLFSTIVPQKAVAARVYRCNGIIQFRPCGSSSRHGPGPSHYGIFSPSSVRATVPGARLSAETRGSKDSSLSEEPRAAWRGQRIRQKAGATVKAKVHGKTKLRKARILKSRFTQLKHGFGRWQGYVTGQGLVQLTLKLFRRGTLISERYMGQVELTKKDREVSFRFDTKLPPGRPGKSWHWKVQALQS